MSLHSESEKKSLLGMESDEEKAINCFALVESDDSNDIVYAAGKNIHQFVFTYYISNNLKQ